VDNQSIVEKEPNIPTEKHPGGRPALFKTPEALQEKVNEFFAMVEKEQEEDSNRTPGIAELAYYLGFESRQSLYDYEKRSNKFSYIIKRARLFIEKEYEKRLSGEKSNPTKWIYTLNAMGYPKDKTDSRSTRVGGNVIIITTDKKPEGLNIDGQEILPDEN
jgi:hypothetical protein